MRRVRSELLAIAVGLGCVGGPVLAQEAEPPAPFQVDNRVMCQFEYHLGDWVPGDPDAPPGIRIEFAWEIPGKVVRDAEYRLVDGEEVQISYGVSGYHYGLMRIEWLSFVRDGVRPFEVMNIGTIEFEPEGVMVRRYRSYDPDTSSREYRETLSPVDENTRRNVILYLDDERVWKEWGVFTHVRKSPRVRSEACAGLT